MRVGVDYMGGEQDSKLFNVGVNMEDDVGDAQESMGVNGCFVLMHLSDNPESVGEGFFDLTAPQPK